MNASNRKDIAGPADFDAESFIEESAEAAYLAYPGEEEEANDNFPAHEILQGCIWRDVESSQQKVGIFEEETFGERSADLDRRGELNFAEDRRGARGFLDEETSPFLPDYPDLG